MAETTKNFIYFCGLYSPQVFSLPDSLIYNISKNPSTPKVYQKLIRSCKYFFVKNPLTAFDDITCVDGKWKRFTDDYIWITYVKKRDFLNKLWFTNKLSINSDTKRSDIASMLIPNVYRLDISYLCIYDQILSFNNFLYLTSTVETLTLHKCSVVFPNGTKLSMEEILMNLEKLENFSYSYRNDESAVLSVENLLNLQKYKALKTFKLYSIPEEFDIQTFYDDFLMKNEIMKVYLDFSVNLSQEYKNKLEKIVDEIIEQKSCLYQCLAFYFQGIDIEKYEKMRFTLYGKRKIFAKPGGKTCAVS